MKKKHLLIFSSLEGALGHYLAHLVPALEERLDVTVIAYKYGHRGDLIKPDCLVQKYIKDYHLLIEFEKWDRILKGLQKILDFFSKRKIDWINVQITEHARKIAYIYFSLFGLLDPQIPRLFNFHDVLPHQVYPSYPAKEEFLEKFYHLADYALVGSRDEKKRLTKIFNYPGSRISIASHGIYSRLDFHRYTKESARRYLKIPPEKKVVLFFGFLKPDKGLDTLIESFPKVVKEHPQSLLYISTTTWWVKDKSWYLERIKKLKMTSFVKFEDRFVKIEEIEPIFKAADLVVLPYREISQSGILKLAFAFGKPIVVSRVVEEAKEINRRFGLAVPPENPALLAKAIISLLSNFKKAEKMGKAGKVYAERVYSWERIAKTMVSSFRLVEQLKKKRFSKQYLSKVKL